MSAMRNLTSNQYFFTRPLFLSCVLAVFILPIVGCDDEQTVVGSVANVSAPDGVLPEAGRKFCFDRREQAPTACRKGLSCMEALPGVELPIAEFELECEADGGELVEHCAAFEDTILGVCLEFDRLRVFYGNAEEAERHCEEDDFEWLSCPASEASKSTEQIVATRFLDYSQLSMSHKRHYVYGVKLAKGLSNFLSVLTFLGLMGKEDRNNKLKNKVCEHIQTNKS
jgi:hypothetical protein